MNVWIEKIVNSRNKIIWIILMGLLIDLFTKYFFYGSNFPFITSVLNTGSAWWFTIPLSIIIIVSLVTIIGIYIWYEKKYISQSAFLFLMIWGIWNLYDRIFYAGVRDRINIHIIPVFNIADICITIWVMLFIYYTICKDNAIITK